MKRRATSPGPKLTEASLIDELAEHLGEMHKLSNRKALDYISIIGVTIFKIIDFRQDGNLDKLEFKRFVRTVADGCEIWSRDEADFAAVDTDGDRFIQEKELITFLKAVYRQVGKRVFMAQMGMITELIETDDTEESEFADLRDTQGCVIPETEERGITISQLHKLLAHIDRRCTAEQWTDDRTGEELKPRPMNLHMPDKTAVNLYHTCEKVLKPATSMRKCSYIEFVADGPQPPEWFVSHFWGDAVAHFVACLEQHITDREMSYDTPYWVCAYANNQWDIAFELREDPSTSSFRRAMERARGTITVLDPEAESFRRIWCCYEVWFSIIDCGEVPFRYDMYTVGSEGACGITQGRAEADYNAEYPVDAKRKREMNFPMELCRQSLSIRLQDATSSRIEDRRMILNSIIKSRRLDADPPEDHEEYEKLNRMLHGLVAGAIWRDALEAGEDMTRYIDALKNCDLPKLEITFDSSSRVTDLGIEQLGETITEGLKEILLDMSYCSQLTDRSMIAIAEGLKMPTALRKISLSFMRVSADAAAPLTDKGLKALAENFPQTVTSLGLNLYGCKHFTDEAYQLLFKGIPTEVTRLDLDFGFNYNLSSAAVLELPRILTNMTDLRLNLHYCTNALTDTFAEAFANGIPPSLKKMRCDFRYGEELTSTGVHKMFKGFKTFGTGLEELWLSLNRCDKLEDTALPAVMPNNLTKMHLGFGFCEKLTKAGMKRLALSFPGKLVDLSLDLNHCAKALETLEDFDPILEGLKELKHLRHLDLGLQGVPCGKQVQAVLRKELADHVSFRVNADESVVSSRAPSRSSRNSAGDGGHAAVDGIAADDADADGEKKDGADSTGGDED